MDSISYLEAGVEVENERHRRGKEGNNFTYGCSILEKAHISDGGSAIMIISNLRIPTTKYNLHDYTKHP